MRNYRGGDQFIQILSYLIAKATLLNHLHGLGFFIFIKFRSHLQVLGDLHLSLRGQRKHLMPDSLLQADRLIQHKGLILFRGLVFGHQQNRNPFEGFKAFFRKGMIFHPPDFSGGIAEYRYPPGLFFFCICNVEILLISLREFQDSAVG